MPNGAHISQKVMHLPSIISIHLFDLEQIMLTVKVYSNSFNNLLTIYLLVAFYKVIKKYRKQNLVSVFQRKTRCREKIAHLKHCGDMSHGVPLWGNAQVVLISLASLMRSARRMLEKIRGKDLWQRSEDISLRMSAAAGLLLDPGADPAAVSEL